MDAVNIPAKFEVRNFTCSWNNRVYWKNLGRHWICPRSLYFKIFKGRLFTWTLWIYLLHLKFVALRVPEIIGGILKKFGSPWIRQRSLFSQILKQCYDVSSVFPLYSVMIGLDGAIFVFADQVSWRLICHVRLCCRILVEWDITFCRELAGVRRGFSLEDYESWVGDLAQDW